MKLSEKAQEKATWQQLRECLTDEVNLVKDLASALAPFKVEEEEFFLGEKKIQGFWIGFILFQKFRL